MKRYQDSMAYRQGFPSLHVWHNRGVEMLCRQGRYVALAWRLLLVAGSLEVLSIGAPSSPLASSGTIASGLISMNGAKTIPAAAAAAASADACMSLVRTWNLRLRGGTGTGDLPDETEWGPSGSGDDAQEGLFPGKWDLAERLRTEPRCDFNVTDDIVRTSSKEDELAFRRQCDEELEQHWARVRRIREDDIAHNRRGCRHVADNEYCVRKSDGRIWKYRYDPDLYSGCGSERDEETALPEPVDFVDPDYLEEIADDLNDRDRRRAQSFQDLVDANDRQAALEEALSWFNGTRRMEYEAGEPLWWRQLTRLNASSASTAGTAWAPQAQEGEEGPEEPAVAQRRAGRSGVDRMSRSSTSDSECSDQETYRQPGQLPAGQPPPDFSAYGNVPAGYCLSSMVAPPELDDVQARLYREMRAEAGVINAQCGREVVAPAVHASGSGGRLGGFESPADERGTAPAKSSQDPLEAGGDGAGVAGTVRAMAGEALTLFNSTGRDDDRRRDADAAAAGGGVSCKSAGYVWNELGETLRSVVWRGKASFVRELLELGADANYLTVYCGWRPVHYAAWNDYPKVLALLVEAGADINARTDYGETPLHLCALKASNQAIKFLIAAGADTSLRHVQGRLALESAHLRMLSCDYPLSRRIGETVRLLANVSRDADAARDALEDLRDHWVPPSGFCS